MSIHRVECLGHGIEETGLDCCGVVELSSAEYNRQMNCPDSVWQCPRCGAEAQYIDEDFEDELPYDGTEFANAAHYLCTVCNENPVDARSGFDTCSSCCERI